MPQQFRQMQEMLANNFAFVDKMKKESSFLYDSDSSDQFFEDDTPCCSLVILPGNRTEEDYLRNIYSRITTPSPVWKESVCIESSQKNNRRQFSKHQHSIPRCFENENISNKTPTQSLSVNFILREELIGNEVHKIRRLFINKPWKFHHTFQTFDMERQKVVAKQPYYELSEEYPLMSPSICHHGSSVLRYNIFVKDKFDEMKYFYMDLLRSQPMYEEQNFCYFTIFSKNGTEIQLSLKHSKQLHIIPTKRTFLKVNIDNVYERVHEMGAKIEEIFCSECGVLVTRDPEGNPILVSGKNSSGKSSRLSPSASVTRKRHQRQSSKYVKDYDDQWSDCSTGCNDCMKKMAIEKRSSRYYYGDQDDSGYHNDDEDVSSGDELYYPKRKENNNHYTSNCPYGGITQQHFPSCKNKGCCDRHGRPFTCCVVNV